MTTEDNIHGGHDLPPSNTILGNLSVGKKTDLVRLFKTKRADEISVLEFLLILSPHPQRQAAIKLHHGDLRTLDLREFSEKQRSELVKAGFLGKDGMFTQKLLDEAYKQAPTHTKTVFRKHALLLKFIESAGENWQTMIVEKEGLVGFRVAAGLQKEGWFSENGVPSEKTRALFKEQDDKDFRYLCAKFTSQHASLLNLLAVYGRSLDAVTYTRETRSALPWDRQLKSIAWMQEKKIIDADWKPTELATQLRLRKAHSIKEQDLREFDLRIEEYLRLGAQASDLQRLKLNDFPAHVLESRILRLRAGGFVDDKLIPTDAFSKFAHERRELYYSNKDPPWLIEKRVPALADLTEKQRIVLVTLATESPYLSLNQLKHHFEIPQTEIDSLLKGELLKMRTEHIGRERIGAVALGGFKTKNLLREAGIAKPLRGKFQRGSHMRHDFMLWESLQEFRKVMQKKNDKVVGVLHERAIYQAKTSANDNKGISTPDLVLRTESGAEYAFEYGNYKPEDMVRKIQNFPQRNVVVFSSDSRRLDQYIALFNKQTNAPTFEKQVTWFYIPEIRL